jgi:hypothetical protein
MDRIGDWRLVSLLESAGEEEIYRATDEAEEELRIRILSPAAPEEDKIAFEEMERSEEATIQGSRHIREIGRTVDDRPYAVYSPA